MVGEAVTELVVTCQTPEDGRAVIRKGDAVVLTGDYEVRTAGGYQTVFGQALADAAGSSNAVPVKVRGICVFAYSGKIPIADGNHGVTTSDVPGAVQRPLGNYGHGLVINVDAEKAEVHVLI